MSDPNSPGSIVRAGYFDSQSSSSVPNSHEEDEEMSETDEESEIRFNLFLGLIFCSGLSLILLAAFLWRKYTRSANCDTAIQQHQAIVQHQMLLGEYRVLSEEELKRVLSRYAMLPQQQYEVMAAEAGMQQVVVDSESYENGGKSGNSMKGGASVSTTKDPCLNCRLIQMGSAISYGDNSCPQCGEFCG